VSWIALRITPESNRDGVIAALFASGSQGVEEDGAAVLTHFPSDAPLADIRAAVIDADPHAAIVVSESPDADYSQWRASVSAHVVGDLVISPPWLAGDNDAGRTIIVDPAMAFGTGEHPTTRGAMRLMHGVIRPGDVVADLGAGSAVLSIAAIKLGAARVAAVEIDHDSIGNAEENVRANGVSLPDSAPKMHVNRARDGVEVIEGDALTLLPLLAPVRVVIANIISSVILSLLPSIKAALSRDGQAIISGILVDERGDIVRALEADGWKVQREDTEDAWWSALIAPR
jgi:ribosomal protein L11 methyltransferase